MTRPQRPAVRNLFNRASDRVLGLVDPNVVLDHVDVDSLLGKVDVNALLDRVDVNDLLDRVDVNRLLDRVDIDSLLARADVDALMDRVNIERVVERAGIPEIVAESTSHLTGNALDLFRKPLVGIDELIVRALNRLFRRDISRFPQGPSHLVEWVEEEAEPIAGSRTGRYAGPLTRLLAVFIDVIVVTLGFTVITAGIVFLMQLVAPGYEFGRDRGLLYVVLYVVWVFLYQWVSIAVFGKTIGKAVLGLRIVTQGGSPGLHRKEPIIRVLTYPLSFAILGIGLLGVVFNPERRAWHDHLAGTVVVYDWGTRTAVMPTPLAEFLDRKTGGR